MTFLWPYMLYSLAVVIPAVVIVYLRLQRQRRALAANFVHAQSQSARRRGPGLRRHVPSVLFLISLAILLVALARPQATLSLPRVEGTVILVIDVSGSMAAADADPSRLDAAKTAAQAFILSQPSTVEIGIVSFSNSGFAVQAPTNDTASLIAAINRLEPTASTSVGQGILVALKTIAVENGLELQSGTESGSGSGTGSEQESEPTPEDSSGITLVSYGSTQNAQPQAQAQDTGEGTTPEDELLAQLPDGAYPSSVIVLLSDGENREQYDPLEAAQVAADHSVRVDVLGFGTTAGTTLEIDGYQVHTAMDEDMLQQVADTAGGSYYNPEQEADPQAIYANLSPDLVIKTDTIEITAVFAGAGLVILLLGAALSMLWFNRLP